LINIGNGIGSNKVKNCIIKIALQKAINASDLLVFISNAVKKTFQDNLKIDNKNSIVIYNGIGSKFFEKNTESTPAPNNNIIFIGRLEKVKGVDILINAFSKVYNKYPNAKLTIVGEGSQFNELEELAKTTSAKENIIFAGRQNNVIDWLDDANIFVYPSIWEEGFGISVVEAMARGCIPITFNKGGLPEIIDNEKNGYIVNIVDDTELANIIIKAINLPSDKKQKMKNNAIATAGKYTIEKTINNIQQAYSDLTNKK
jgi:glycosyltransferase involved in cell wall biosynthesis